MPLSSSGLACLLACPPAYLPACLPPASSSSWSTAAPLPILSACPTMWLETRRTDTVADPMNGPSRRPPSALFVDVSGRQPKTSGIEPPHPIKRRTHGGSVGLNAILGMRVAHVQDATSMHRTHSGSPAESAARGDASHAGVVTVSVATGRHKGLFYWSQQSSFKSPKQARWFIRATDKNAFWWQALRAWQQCRRGNQAIATWKELHVGPAGRRHGWLSKGSVALQRTEPTRTGSLQLSASMLGGP